MYPVLFENIKQEFFYKILYFAFIDFNCMLPVVVCCNMVLFTFFMLIRYKFSKLILPLCGEGGTFALYSLLCRHAKINTIPNQHRTDEELTTYVRSTFHERSFAAKTKRWLERYALRKNALLILVLVGTCMVIGDGILTPAISGIPSFRLELSTYLCFSLFVSRWKFYKLLAHACWNKPLNEICK